MTALARLMPVNCTHVEETVINAEPVDPFDKLWNWGVNKVKQGRKQADLAILRSKLKKVIEQAKAHDQKGTKKGDNVYKELYADAFKYCNEFAIKYNMDVDSIMGKVPALRELYTMATYDPQAAAVQRMKMYIGGLIALPFVILVIGMLAGICVVGFHSLTFWMHN